MTVKNGAESAETTAHMIGLANFILGGLRMPRCVPFTALLLYSMASTQ